MKYLVASFILFFCTLQTFGQQDYFIYLQTDNSQAFYIRINNAVYSSTPAGYLILSKLPDSTAYVTIGFAKNVYPEQQFNIPVNHKDGGYLIKNFGDKGWGLFNLQTLAVIMSSTPAEEKKSPEITGSRKNDAFSLLLANAVNDTAVLYVVNKPKKITPVPVQVVDEIKKDTVALVKADTVKKDSAAIVKKIASQKDSTLAAKAKTDSIARVAIATKPLRQNNKPANKESRTGDTALVVKNKPSQPPPTTPGKNAGIKPAAGVSGKNIAKQNNKDTIIIARNNRTNAPENSLAQKNSNERKDTIILMNNKPPTANKTVAKNTAPNKPASIKKDSLLLARKETTIKKEEKIVPPVQQPPVAEQNLPPKKDSIAGNNFIKKDTVIAPVVASPTKPAADTTAVAVKRSGPVVTKAAELFTDTSYVAVFVDESKDIFDTIRISIPFFETIARATQQPASVKEKTKQADSNLSAITTTVKDSAPPPVATKPAPVKNDTTIKTVKDSTPVTSHIIAKDTGIANRAIKDSAVMPVQQPPAPVKKQDTVTIPPIMDSGRVIKAPQQAVLKNSDCKEIAWDSDIDKLRIKMLVVATDDERITLAKKVYRQKCFSVKQVRALSELFKTDEGKYKWFDAVYPFVTDSSNFSLLGELIKSDYYLNRFKAMLRN